MTHRPAQADRGAAGLGRVRREYAHTDSARPLSLSFSRAHALVHTAPVRNARSMHSRTRTSTGKGDVPAQANRGAAGLGRVRREYARAIVALAASCFL